MRRVTKQTRRNQERSIDRFDTNDELQRHLKRGMFRQGALMVLHGFLNRFRSAERQKLLPP